MREEVAATRIQKWWRMVAVRRFLVFEARDGFERMCEEFGDQKPTWTSDNLVMPTFRDMSPEIERIWLEHAIAHRISVLKYEEQMSHEQ